MGKTRLCLATMVKNEEHILERMLRSILPYIDSYCVLDTGSTDSTIEIAERVLAEIPGEIHQEPFIDFAQSRNRLLFFARQVAAEQDCSYLVLADADHVFHVEGSGFDDLTADSYLLELRGSLSYRMPYTIKSSAKMVYISPTHEYLSCEDGGFIQENLDTVWLEHHGDGGNRHDKFDRDIMLLEKEIANDPNNQRTVFYLANTYRDLGRHEEALELYRRRVDLGDWDEEVFYTLLQIAGITNETDDYLRAYSFRPTRKEPLHRLTRHLNEKGYHKAAYIFGKAGVALPKSDDILFVDAEADDYAMEFEYAIAAWWVGDRDTAKTIFTDLLTRTLPPHYREAVETNIQHCP